MSCFEDRTVVATTTELMGETEMLDNMNRSITMESSSDIFRLEDEFIVIYTWVVLCVGCQLLNIFGIVTNIINIICFVKQGFKDPVNITLLGLSVSDLGSLVTMVWTCICVTPAFSAADLPFESMEVTYLITALPHLSFTRVSSCIMAVITLERCLCIIAPLKIKRIITPTRAAVVTVCVFIIFFSTVIPVYLVHRLDMKFSAIRNKTLVGLVFLTDRDQVEKIYIVINSFVIPVGAFVIIVICTILLSIKLRDATEWRNKDCKTVQVDRVYNRNQKVAKMVVMISILFIVSFIPINVMILTLVFTPALALGGEYLNITVLVSGFGYVMEDVNSSMNIFIYYHMSTKYREQFYRIFYRDIVRYSPKT